EIYKLQAKELREDGKLETLFYDVVMPVASMYADIEYHGVYVDAKKLNDVEKHLEDQYATVMARLHELKPGLNINSPIQVAKFLFHDVGLVPLDITKTGNASTNESVLQRLSELHEAPQLILKAREYSKQLSTFIRPWRNKRDNNSR